MKSEIFAKILQKVSEVTELSPENILSRTKTDDLVAARSLFVHHCFVYGLPSISIAKFMNRSKVNCINRYLEAYQSYRKSSYFFREMDKKVSDAIHISSASCPK